MPLYLNLAVFSISLIFFKTFPGNRVEPILASIAATIFISILMVVFG